MPGMLWQGDAARGHPSAGRWGGTKILTNIGDLRRSEMASIVNTLESWQDLEADVKTVVKILGCR